MLEALTDKFSREGFLVLQAKDGEEGVDLALRDKPDIILLDLVMPKMTGAMVVERLRKDPWGKTVPIVILSNLTPNDRLLKQLMEGGIAYCLIKSESKIEDVVQKVKEAVGEAK